MQYNDDNNNVHTVLSVAMRNIPGTATPAPPPMVIPSKTVNC